MLMLMVIHMPKNILMSTTDHQICTHALASGGLLYIKVRRGMMTHHDVKERLVQSIISLFIFAAQLLS